MKDEYVIPMFGHTAVMININYFNELKALSDLLEKDNISTEIEKDFIEAIYNGSSINVDVISAGVMEFSSTEIYEVFKQKTHLAIAYTTKENGKEPKRIGANHLCGRCERILNDSDIYCSQCGFKINRNEPTNK